MNRIEMNRLCKSMVEFVEENPNCTRVEVAQAVAKGQSVVYAWDTIKHLFEYKPSNGRAPVTYKRNKIAYSRNKTKKVVRKKAKPSLALMARARTMKTLVNESPGITGADIRKQMGLNVTRFKQASRLIEVDRKRTFGRGTGYWPLGTAPETVRAVRVQSYTPVAMRVPTFDGVILTQWRGGNPFTQMSTQ